MCMGANILGVLLGFLLMCIFLGAFASLPSNCWKLLRASARKHSATRLPLTGYSKNVMLESFKINCEIDSVLVEIEEITCTYHRFLSLYSLSLNTRIYRNGTCFEHEFTEGNLLFILMTVRRRSRVKTLNNSWFCIVAKDLVSGNWEIGGGRAIYEGWNFNSGNYLFTTDTK